MLTDHSVPGVVDPTGSPSRYRQILKHVLLAVVPRRYFIAQGPTRSGMVALTFDDGPHPEHTPVILKALRESGVRATFFIVGERAIQFPQLIGHIVAEGHAIGHHSFRHAPPSETSASQLIQEIAQTSDALRDVLGVMPRLFRPPQGKLTVGKIVRLWLAGQAIVLWSVDPRDYACSSSEEVLRRLQAAPLRSGDIVLLHDSQPFAASILGRFIMSVRGQGLGFCTLDQWAV